MRSKAIATALMLMAGSAGAAEFATSVVSYSPGTYAGSLTTTSAAVGAPGAIVGAGSGFDSILSPFNPHYEPSQIVGIGKGGHLTVRLAHPMQVTAGREVGIFTNLGLVDVSYPNGVNSTPASTFNPLPRAGDVEVSIDGTTFFPAGRITFESPTNYFANASSPYLTAPPANPVLADFGQPFTGGLSPVFDGQNWTQTLAALDGSAGGTWVDVSTTPLQFFQYVRVSIPLSGIAGSDDQVFVDAVSVANAALPEPTGVLGGAMLFAMSLWRRRA